MCAEHECDHCALPKKVADAIHNKLWDIHKKYTRAPEGKDRIRVLAGPYEYEKHGRKGARTIIDLSGDQTRSELEAYQTLGRLLFELSKVPETVRKEQGASVEDVPDNSVTWRLRSLTKATETPH